MKTSKIYIFRLVACLFSMFIFMGIAASLMQQVNAQGMTNINVTGIPPLIEAPFTDQFEQNFRNGRYQVFFTYNNSNIAPVDFRFRFRVTRDGKELFEVTSNPEPFEPGGYVFTSIFDELTFPQTFEEVVDQLDSKLRRQIIQEGSLPEGSYMLNIQAIPENNSGMITNVQSVTPFTVRFPQPPIPINPPDQSNITMEIPVFNWTPVVVPGFAIEYDFLLVEVLQSQTPLQAINSNRAHAERTLMGQNTLLYTPEFLPLEEGSLYAWRITARSPGQALPLKNEGESEIQTFTYRKQGGDELIAGISEIESITLIPGFAKLTALDELNSTEAAGAYILDGTATLELNFANQQSEQIRVQVNNLRIQKQSLSTPVLLGGSLRGKAPDLRNLLEGSGTVVQADEIFWKYNQGVTTTAKIITPEGFAIKADGELTLSSFEVRGSVAATSETNEPLIRVGKDPFILQINSISAEYPGGMVRASGSATALGDVKCELPSMYLQDNEFTGYLNCDLDKTIPLVRGSEQIRLKINDITGVVDGSWGETPDLAYDVTMRSDIELLLDGAGDRENKYCGASGVLKINDETGFEARDFSNSCILPDPSLDLGILNMSFSNLELSVVDFTEEGAWDFELLLDAELFFPSETDIKLPLIEGIVISPDGISLPEVTFGEDVLQPYATIGIDQFGFSLTNFSLQEQLFPWYEWDGGAGPWDFSFDANVQLPDRDGFPVCIRNSTIALSNAEMVNGSVQGSLQAALTSDCRWEFGPGYAFDISNAAGSLQIAYESGTLRPEANFNFDGMVELGSPFLCEPPAGELEKSDMAFSVNDDGISGEINNVVPTCPLSIGPYSATISNSDLMYSISGTGEHAATLSGTAALDLGVDQQAEGTFALNLITGEFAGLNFELEGPFEWGIPKENPVLVFDVDRAVVNETGLFIDGRQSLVIDDETMGVTFDELTVDWNTFEVISGRIIFDEVFTFEAGIDGSTSLLSYSATLRDSSLALSPGVLLTLAGAAVIDSTGLKTSGQSQGELQFNDIEVDDLEVIFSEKFSFGLDPFGVKSGLAELYWDDQRIAIIDPSGFHPDIGFLGEEFLPERVPLPTEDVAYLEIKRNGQLLVDATNLGDGTYRIETLSAEPLKMVLPALQGTNPAPPEVEVTLTDFIINPSTGNYISGTAGATVSDSGQEFDLESLGIPLTLEELIFTTQQIEQGNLTALFLKGKITVFDHEFRDSGSATFFIQNNGRVKGTLALSGLNEQLGLQPGSDRVVYELDALAGYVDIPITVPGSPDFQFDMGGRFLIQDLNDQPVASAPLQSRFTEQGFSIIDFDASGFVQSSTLDFEFFRFTIDQISSLSLSYSTQNGFDFSAGLDMQIDLLPSAGSAIEIPLKNVEIRSDEGIVIPSQNIHDGSMPLMDAPAFDLGIFRLQPLAFRTEPFTLNIFDLSAGDLISLMPEIDLEVTFPAFSGASTELNQIALSIYDASFDNGIIAGTVYPYDVFGDPIFIPIGPAGIAVDLFEGRLYATDEGEQGMEIDLAGLFQMPENFADNGQPCSDTRVDFALSLNGGFSGRAEQFLPCGQLSLGPLSLGFGQSVLDLNYENDQQSATLSGTANAEIKRDGQPSIMASGNLTYNLMNGSIISGSIGINEPFTWGLPAEDPLFEFTVQTAAINTAGLIFNGNGNLATGDGSAGVLFNNLAFRLSDGEIKGGDVQVQNEFAVDIEFGPTRWAVTDPSSNIGYESGIRLGFPSNITIDSAGFSSTGQSTASIRYAGEVYDNLQVNFVDMGVGLSPVSVVSGRADLMLNQERLAYYDSGGFHLDNLAGAITDVLPDTLGLPNKDIAYIILKDEQGALLVDTAEPDAGAGLQLSTTNPLPLVLAGLGESDSNAPRIDVSFSELVINDAFEVISGSITANVSGTPLNVNDYPIGLTAVHYKKETGQPYKLYADARMQLPQSLSDLELLVEDIILGSDGFQEFVFSAGSYTITHSEGGTQPVATESFANGDFEIAVRGVEMNFGSEEFKFSGDLSSSFLSSSNGDPALLHFSSEHSSGDWTFALDTDHLSSNEVPIGNATLVLVDLDIDTNSGFDVAIDGRLKMADVLGSDFEISFTGLKVGTSGVSLESGSAAGDHNIGLFGEDDNFTLNDPSLSIDNNHLQIITDGNLNILGRSFGFTNLQIGTDGTFQLGSGGGALVTEPVNLMDEFLVLNSLNLGVQDNRAQLTAGLTATLPEPLESKESTFDLTINHNGKISSNGFPHTIEFAFNEAGVGIGEIASMNLTGLGLKINNIHDLNMTLFASADLIIQGKTIQFGTDGGAVNYGIRYQTTENSLEWRITNSPTFTFDAGILDMTIEENSLSPTDPTAGSFGISMNTTGKPKLPGVAGDGLTLHGFTITTSGIGSMGDVAGGSFTLADVITFELGKFEWGKNTTISVTNQSGYQEDPNIGEISNDGNQKGNIEVDEYLKFSPGTNAGKAIKITIPGGFSGEIQELFYYRNSDTFYLKIEGVKITFGTLAELTASLEYMSMGGDDFRLLVAGGGSIKGPLGDDSFGFAALGAMSNIGDDFRFGIFVNLQANIRIVPGILSLTKVGGGFFYNPEDNDFDQIISTAGHSFENVNGGSREKPWVGRTGLSFGIALYAEASLISSVNAAQGSTILFLTNQFFYVDMDATLLGMGDEFKAGLTLLVQWDPNVLVKGSAFSKMGIDPLLTSTMEMSLVIGYPEGETDFIWGFTASADFEILHFLDAEGDIMVSNTGFYVGVSVNGGFDIWVISVSASFDAQIWWIYGDANDADQFGAYVEIDVSATLFKVATVGANLKGALIIDSGYLIYAEASAYVSVFLVFNGNVSIWAAIRNGKVSGGKGSNSEYTSMIDDARRNARSIKDQMDQLIAQLDEISGAIEILKMTDEELDNAGQTLIGLDRDSQSSYFNVDISRFITVPQVHEQIRDHILGSSAAEWQPVEPGPELNTLLADMNQKIDELKTINETVKGRFEEAYELALEWDAEAMDLMDFVQNPVKKASFGALDTDKTSGDIGNTPEFDIDETIDYNNQKNIEAYREQVAEMEAQFRAAIDSVHTYINRVDQMMSATDAGATETDQPSAKEVADQYVETTAAIDKYYGNLVSHFWETSRWAKIKYDNFDNLAGTRSEVIDANERILNNIWGYQGLYFEFIPGPEGADEEDAIIRDQQNNIVEFEYDEDELDMDSTDDIYGRDTDDNRLFDAMFDTRADMIARQERMYVLANGNNWQDASWRQQTNVFENKLDEFLRDKKYTSFFGTFIQKGIEYWYEIPKRGLTQISQNTAFTADSLATDYRSKVRNVVNAHKGFTSTLDDIYRVKSSLTLTLHGIVDLYIKELETASDSVQTSDTGESLRPNLDEKAQQMRDLKDEIETTLQPPRIVDVRVHKHLDQYNNKVDLFWSATHPTGTITEYSYLMEDDSFSSNDYVTLQLGRMLSTGNENWVTRYLFKENKDQVNKNMQVLVRARGPSGAAISRSANFTVSVDINEGAGSFQESQGLPEDIDQEDKSPPTRPNVEFDYVKSERSRLIAQQSSDQFGVPVINIVEDEVYWTNVADRIEFDVYSIDPESDISGYEYALGTSVSQTDIRDYTRIQGLDIESEFLGDTNLNDWQRIRIQNLDLSEQDHYLSIRAINGDGLESIKRFVSHPIVYSGEPPVVQDFNEVQPPDLSPVLSQSFSAVFEQPSISIAHWSDLVPPAFEISWLPAVSARAGIQKYEYIVSEMVDAEAAFGQSESIYVSTDNTARLVESNGISYSEDFYVHLRAIDNAGNISENTATLGPLVVPDPTRPDTPVIRATSKPDGIGFYIQGPALDRESGIEKYEYTIAEVFGPNKFSWTEIDVKNPLNTLYPGARPRSSYTPIPLTGVEEGKNLVIKVRAVNNQGISSGIAQSGPVVYDTSPPQTPTINLSKSGDMMTINISNLHDPESGVKKVEYRVCDARNFMVNCFMLPGNLGDWKDLANYTAGRKSLFQLSRQVNISQLNYPDVKVFVRVTNRNGMQTTTSYKPQPILTFPDSSGDNDYNYNLNIFNYNF